VTKLSNFPQVVAVKQDFPAKTIQEYIAAAKERPATISYGTPPAAGMATWRARSCNAAPASS